MIIYAFSVKTAAMLGRILALWICLFPICPSAAGTFAAAPVETPLELYGQMFVDVQLQRVFPDSKTFADAVPNDTPANILERYNAERLRQGFDLPAFVMRNFSLPQPRGEAYRAVPGQDVCDHVDGLWSVLKRRPEPVRQNGSLLPLPYPYVVPGGRFTEIYYWDLILHDARLGAERTSRAGPGHGSTTSPA